MSDSVDAAIRAAKAKAATVEVTVDPEPILLGTLTFIRIPFPLVIGDRFFSIYHDSSGKLKFDAFRWDATNEAPVWEVRHSQPLGENIKTGPTGRVTYTTEDDGFLFTFRPKPGESQLFGHIDAEGGLQAHITHHLFQLLPIDFKVEGGTFTGHPIAFQVGFDGIVTMMPRHLPKGMRLVQRRPG